ncbi:ABC transporter [Bowdeniella nasicola]|uniref:ABC transporter n=1 Tax=Bowdeniella nasicola TaxID=208480 RepID=A0A1H4C3Q0_9ACTO|nr:ATP-binding cassette domain-containing protein [Bowdeniella nasicola]SEA55031.1 ABC transporter [Bowdeniella nasicola]
MTASVMIEAQGVDFSYGKTQVLHDVTMQVNRGEIVALLGPNGVGKTTLVENLVGTLSPTAGTVRILGEDQEGRRRFPYPDRARPPALGRPPKVAGSRAAPMDR